MWNFPKWKIILLGANDWYDNFCLFALINLNFWKHVLIIFVSSVEGLVQTIGGIHTAGSLQVLLLQVCFVVVAVDSFTYSHILFFIFFISFVFIIQALIPFSMVGSLLFLRARYTVVQYAGAAVIVTGVVVALWPNLLHSKVMSTIFFLHAHTVDMHARAHKHTSTRTRTRT